MVHKVQRRMRAQLTISQRFFGFLLFASIIPLVIVGGTSYQVARSVLRAEAMRSTAAIVADQKEYLELQLHQVDSLIANISSVEAIVTALESEGATTDTYTRLATQARIGYILDGYTQLEGLVSIDIFTSNGFHYHVGDTLDVSQIRDEVKDRIFDQALHAVPRVVWTGIEENVNVQSSFEQVITAAKMLTKTDSRSAQRRPIGLLIVNYSVDYFYNHFKQIDLGQGAYLLIVDTAGRIIYHPDQRHHGAVVSRAFISKLAGSSGAFTDSIDGQPMIITYNRAERSDWVVLSLIPVATLNAYTNPIGITTIVVMLGALGFVFLSAWYVSRTVVAPIRSITQHFKLFQAGTLDTQKRLKAQRADEIGELITWFNTFMASLRAKQETERALRESEARFRNAFDYAPVGMALVALDGRWLQVNPALCSIVGYTRHTLRHMTTQDITHPDDLLADLSYTQRLLAGEISSYHLEKRYLRQDGEVVWALVGVSLVRDAHGVPLHFILQMQDITERKALAEQLEHIALHDPLTNLPNRMLFMERLAYALARVEREPHAVAVLFLDVDRFKIVNDSLGHAAGDDLLCTLATRLKACVRPGDTVARLGGDEFSILLEDVPDMSVAITVAERILAAVQAPTPLDEHKVFVTASIGIALSGRALMSPEVLIQNADMAQYQAKRSGKACYAVFESDPSLNARPLDRLELEIALRGALERDEFRVYYQPIVHLETGQVCEVEALVRWEHPQRGLISPAEFIPLAEETGLILPLGNLVLAHACRQTQVWQREHPNDPPLMLNVNLSARQFQHPRLVADITRILHDTGLPPTSLKLEITENVAMQHAETTIAMLRELKRLNVHLAIDDFGTGYSSLAYLKRFPIDTLKIDHSFVDRLGQDEEDTAIVGAIITLAKTLKLRVTAEGIETQEQLDWLRSLGCDFGQGYYLAEPLAADAMSALLATSAELATTETAPYYVLG